MLLDLKWASVLKKSATQSAARWSCVVWMLLSDTWGYRPCNWYYRLHKHSLNPIKIRMVHYNKLHEEWPLARYLLLHAAWSTIWQTLSTVQGRLMSGNYRRLHQDRLFVHLTLLISWKLHVVIIFVLKMLFYVSEIMPQGINVSESKQQFIFSLLWPLTFPSRWPKLAFGAGITSRCIL